MSIKGSARDEMMRVGFPEDEIKAIEQILDIFFDMWDSGGAVSVMAPVLQRLIAGKPLRPLTGEDSEWFIHDMDDRCYAQNIRCGSVFKHRDGKCYDIDADDPNREITFPYSPKRAEVRSPVIEFEVPDAVDPSTKL
jgi:hypothetical protein